MTTQLNVAINTPRLNLTISRKPQFALQVLPRFPVNIDTEAFLTAEIDGVDVVLGVDYMILDPTPILNPAASYVAVWDATSQTFKVVSVSSLIAGATQIEQLITAPGPVTVLNNAGIVRVNQSVGAPITLNLPPAANKTCPVLIADWKGDAGTNNITVVPNGSEKIQGLSQWVIAGDTGSIFLRPIPGVGYVI